MAKRLIISIPAKQADDANAWVKENADMGVSDTFISDENGVCSAGIPDDGSPYSEAMKKQFADYLVAYDPDNTDLDEIKIQAVSVMTTSVKANKLLSVLSLE